MFHQFTSQQIFKEIGMRLNKVWELLLSRNLRNQRRIRSVLLSCMSLLSLNKSSLSFGYVSFPFPVKPCSSTHTWNKDRHSLAVVGRNKALFSSNYFILRETLCVCSFQMPPAECSSYQRGVFVLPSKTFPLVSGEQNCASFGPHHVFAL